MNEYIMCLSKGIFMCGCLYSLGPQEGRQQNNSTDIKKITEENRIIFCERTLDKNKDALCYNQTCQHWQSLGQSIKCIWSQFPHLNIRSSCLCMCVQLCVCMFEQELFIILSPSIIIHWEFIIITTAVGKFRFTKKIDFGKFKVQWKKQVIKALRRGYKVRTQGRTSHNDFLGLSCLE